MSADDILDSTEEERVEYAAWHILVDEIKLKGHFAWCIQTEELVAFCAVGNTSRSLKDHFASLLSSDEDDTEGEEKNNAAYANQWRFRSVYGTVHNAELFFNAGSLNGDEMLGQQFIDVVTCYEGIGVKVFGLVGDAGGGNASLYWLLRDSETLDVA